MRRRTRVRAYDRRTGHVNSHERGYEGASGLKKASMEARLRELQRLWSYRDWQPGEFQEAYLACGEDDVCQRSVRSSFHTVEGGRYWKMVDRMHSFLFSLDGDEKKLFLGRYPGLKKLLLEYAIIEEMAKEGLR